MYHVMVSAQSQINFVHFKCFATKGWENSKRIFILDIVLKTKQNKRFHWQFRFFFDFTRLKKYALNFCNFYLWFKSLYAIWLSSRSNCPLVFFKESLFLMFWFSFRCCWLVHKHIFVLYFILYCTYNSTSICIWMWTCILL